MPTFLTTDDLAVLCRTTAGTVRYWRHIKQGPPSFRLGRRVLYDSREVDAWLQRVKAGSGRGAA